MKNVYLFLFPFLFSGYLVSAQTCTGGGAAATVTLTLTGKISFDEYGTAINQTGILNAAITGDVVAMQVTDANLNTVGASWCSEALLELADPTFNGGIIYGSSAQGGSGPCSDLPATGFFNLASLNLAFPTGASGAIRWELFEDIDNDLGFADANWNVGTITLFICPPGEVLPVELKSFNGKTLDFSNMLYWATDAEQNVQWHIIERSANGIDNWIEIGKIAGKKETQSEQKYSLEDYSPLAKAYYRLRSVDMDGKEQFYKSIVLVRPEEQFGILKVIPSPTAGVSMVQYITDQEESVTLRVTDIAGRLVWERFIESVSGINNLPVDFSTLQAGIYIITVSTEKAVSSPVRVVRQ